MTNNKYDLIIIGGGPGGYSAAISAAKDGLSVLLFEREHLGGTCLNVGCIPTKFLLDKAATMEKIRILTEQEIFKDAGVFSYKKIQKEKSVVVKKLTSGVNYLLQRHGVTVIKKEAILTKGHQVECEGEVYEATNIIIATGSVHVSIPIKGAELAITSTEALELEKIPEKLVVIGGGVIGMELASAFCSFGSEVTVVEFLPQLFPTEDKEAISYMLQQLKKRGIRILSNTEVKEIQQTVDGVQVVCYGREKEATKETIKAEYVLMAAGRKSSLRGIDTENIRISLTDKKDIRVNEYMETSIPHIYAIGDVVGGYQLAHAAYIEAEAAVAHMLGGRKAVELEPMPRCIYTMPCYAAVGMTQERAEQSNIEVVCGTCSYSGNGMALAEGTEGLVKVVMDKENHMVIGVFIVGECAAELIATASLAVKKRMTFEEWKSVIVAHPSLAEMLKEAVLDCFGKSIHKG